MVQSQVQKHRFFPIAVNRNSGESKLASFIKSCHELQLSDIETLINKNMHHDLLCAIFADSPYLSHLLLKDVKFARKLLAESYDTSFLSIIQNLNETIPALRDTNQIRKTLRQAKAQVALIISFADLSGSWPLERVTKCLTEFAETTVSLVVSHLLCLEMIKGNLAIPPHFESTPVNALLATADLSYGTGYVVLAMGKMGSYELNYSSDIDLIVLYDNDLVQYTGRRSAQDLFIKLTQNLVKIMQERTEDGYIFRTDLRLRPDPGATAVALSMEGAEIYYQSMGLNWERAAMIKARPVAGDIQAGHEFLSRIKSFVWRKHLDYVALEDIYSIKKLIHQHHGHRKFRFAGQDIKLGHGGIREIEFFAQIFQLIAGGREPELRTPATCDALNSLEKNQKITSQDYEILQQAYVYYRTLEHRLQMINDDQTHSMPESDNHLARITSFMGYQKQSEFEKELYHHLTSVHLLFSNLLKEAHQDEDEASDQLAFPNFEYNSDTLKVIEAAGFSDPKDMYSIIQTWLLGRYRACRTERARKILQKLIPEILSSFGKLSNPDASLHKFDKFLSRLPSGIQLFSFIKAQPWLLELLAEIIGMAPNLSDQLAQRPLLLDAVLNQDFFKASLTTEQLKAQLEEKLALAKDFQDILDIVRKWANELKFQIGVQILRNNIDARTAGNNLSMIADVILEVMLKKVKDAFAIKHGEIKGASFAILALGKMGGRELTTTSDLDLIFIYDAQGEQLFSNGPKQLSINRYFARLSQQFINALTAMTGEGKLYDIDMRLRPSGNAGPIAITLASFNEYQTKNAWTWEHLALIRGRVVCGEPGLRKNITETITQALSYKKGNLDKLLLDTSNMREKLRKEFSTGNLWSIKHARGGMVDIEFICQYLILKYSADNPCILVSNTLDQISQLKISKIIPADTAEILFESCKFLQNLQVILRLCLGGETNIINIPSELVNNLCERFAVSSIDNLAERVKGIRRKVYYIYQEIIELPAKKIIVAPSGENKT